MKDSSIEILDQIHLKLEEKLEKSLSAYQKKYVKRIMTHYSELCFEKVKEGFYIITPNERFARFRIIGNFFTNAGRKIKSAEEFSNHYFGFVYRFTWEAKRDTMKDKGYELIPNKKHLLDLRELINKDIVHEFKRVES